MSTDSVSVLPWPKLKAKRAAAGPRLIDSVSGLSGGVFPSVSGLSGSVPLRHKGVKSESEAVGCRFWLALHLERRVLRDHELELPFDSNHRDCLQSGDHKRHVL